MWQFHKFITWRLRVARHVFGRLRAHHQELTTALTASGFTVGVLVVAALLVVVRPDYDQQRRYHQRSNGKTRGC